MDVITAEAQVLTCYPLCMVMCISFCSPDLYYVGSLVGWQSVLEVYVQ